MRFQISAWLVATKIFCINFKPQSAVCKRFYDAEYISNQLRHFLTNNTSDHFDDDMNCLLTNIYLVILTFFSLNVWIVLCSFVWFKMKIASIFTWSGLSVWLVCWTNSVEQMSLVKETTIGQIAKTRRKNLSII